MSRTHVIVVILSIALSACGGPDAQDGSEDAGSGAPDPAAAGIDTGDAADVDAEPTAVRVTVSNATEPYIVPWLAAQDQGFFLDEGVDVTEIVAGSGGTTTLRSLISGDLALGEVSFPAVVEAHLEGIDVQIVGGATQSVTGLDFYTSADSDVTSIDGARRWGFTNPDSVTEALVQLIIGSAGLDDAEAVATGGIGEGVALLEAGDIDVAVVPPSLVASEPDRFRLITASADHLPAFQQSVLAVASSRLEAEPEIIEGIVAGYAAGVDWIAGHVEEAGRLYADHVDAEPEFAIEVVREAVETDTWSAGLQARALAPTVDAMAASGLEEVPWCDLVAPAVPEGIEIDLPVNCGGA